MGCHENLRDEGPHQKVPVKDALVWRQSWVLQTSGETTSRHCGLPQDAHQRSMRLPVDFRETESKKMAN